ncbi:melanocyte-stimulating hormone receptor-like [Oculina patagonica]
MIVQFCAHQLEEFKIILQPHATLMLILCVLFLAFSIVATIGNILVIRALWKASSIPATLKKLFLSLAVSDLTMGLFAQPMFGVMVAVMLKMTASGDYNLDLFCPSVFTICHFSLFFLASASLLNVTAIAADRLLAIFLHLRYQELVTPKRVFIALVSVWITSAVAASIYILLPSHNDRVSEGLELVGLLVTTVAYGRIYKAVRYHQNQIQSQCQLQNGQAMESLRERKSAINALFVYVVFLACYLPYLCCTILLIVDKFRISFLAAYEVSLFLIILNSSINPIVYCWRYREIREIVKNIVKEILHITF